MQKRQQHAIETWVSDRTPRPLLAPVMAFELTDEAAALRAEPAWQQQGHNARTLIKHSEFRLLLIVLQQDVGFPLQALDERVCLQALSGQVTVSVPTGELELQDGRLLALDRGVDFEIRARRQAELLLWLGWSED